jgi:hypothetical protein
LIEPAKVSVPWPVSRCLLEKITMKKIHLLLMCLPFFLLISCFVAVAEDQPANVGGKWQLSWVARMGTERGSLQIEQANSKLTGNYQGRLGSPKVWGNIEGKNIILNLEFQGSHPFTLTFRGTVDGEKMGGKFDVQGVPAGYDSHGENAHPTDYSWTAVRQPRQSDTSQNQTDSKEKSRQ